MGFYSYFKHNLTAKLLDQILPPLCPSCDALVDTVHNVCGECWGKLSFIQPPFCQCCGLPFAVPVGQGMLCPVCAATPPAFTTARAALSYDAGAQNFILPFKHADQLALAPLLAKWLGLAGAELLNNADYLIPVPLHRWRLWRRRYNQAAVLGQLLAKQYPITLLVDGLVRQKATAPQGQRKRAERLENLRGAFCVGDAVRERIKGKSCVILDDVHTTGATLNGCAQVLLKAGAARVDALTIARVPLTGI